MRKYFIKIGLFVLAFGFGISVVALLNYIYIPQKSALISDKNTAVGRKGEGIVIEFKRFAETEYGSVAAEFEISNYTDKVLTYRAYYNLQKDEVVNYSTDYKVDGKKVDQWLCGTGLIDFQLKPDESKTFRTTNFSHFWKKDKSIEFGFGFSESSLGNYKIFWSKPLIIPAEIEEKLIKEQQELKLSQR